MLSRKSLFLLVAFLPIFSCSKDDLTRPVEAELVIEMESPEGGSGSDLLEVKGGRLLLEGLEFDGDRESGENYFFTRAFEGGRSVTFSKEQAGHIMRFEMPKGIYNRIVLSMDLPAGNDEAGALDTFDRTAIKGGVELWGTYSDTHGVAIPFLFIYALPDNFRFTARGQGGSQQVVITEKNKYLARLQFQPQRWMDLINPRMLQSGKLTLVSGEPTIVISRNQNEAIFNLLVNRIEQSALFLFE